MIGVPLVRICRRLDPRLQVKLVAVGNAGMDGGACMSVCGGGTANTAPC